MPLVFRLIVLILFLICLGAMAALRGFLLKINSERCQGINCRQQPCPKKRLLVYRYCYTAVFFSMTMMSVIVLAPIIDSCFSYPAGATLTSILSIVFETTAKSFVQKYHVDICLMDSYAWASMILSLISAFLVVVLLFIIFFFKILKQVVSM